MLKPLSIASDVIPPRIGNRRCTPMSGAEHRRASAFIGGFKQLRLFHVSFINHASRTKFDRFVNFVSTKWTSLIPPSHFAAHGPFGVQALACPAPCTLKAELRTC